MIIHISILNMMGQITFDIIDEDNNKLQFKTLFNQKMSKVFSSYKERNGINYDISFIYNLHIISDFDTPYALDMKNNEKIYCIRAAFISDVYDIKIHNTRLNFTGYTKVCPSFEIKNVIDIFNTKYKSHIPSSFLSPEIKNKIRYKNYICVGNETIDLLNIQHGDTIYLE